MARLKKKIYGISTIVLLIIGIVLLSSQFNFVYPRVFPYVCSDELSALRNDPSIHAFLDTLSYAEGTFNNSESYRMHYTGKLFNNFEDHPRQIICANADGKTLCSTAAGRYQLLSKTWDKVAPKISAQDFSPRNQDRAAIQLLIDNNALDSIKMGKFAEAVEKVNKIWASLPGSPYGQPTFSYEELIEVYRNSLKKYKLAHK